MLYKAKQQLVLLILVLIFQTSIVNSNLFLYFLYTLIVFTFIGALIKYEFMIKNTCATFKILFFSIPIYVQTFSQNEVVQIKFKRFGWQKGAEIKVKGKPNLRLSKSQPTKLYSDLNDFAIKNNIKTIKTNDFGNL